MRLYANLYNVLITSLAFLCLFTAFQTTCLVSVSEFYSTQTNLIDTGFVAKCAGIVCSDQWKTNRGCFPEVMIVRISSGNFNPISARFSSQFGRSVCVTGRVELDRTVVGDRGR